MIYDSEEYSSKNFFIQEMKKTLRKLLDNYYTDAV